MAAIKPCLPKHDRNTKGRTEDLQAAQRLYRYNYQPETLIPADDPAFADVKLAVLAEPVPAYERFTAAYITRRIAATTLLLSNKALMNAWRPFDPLDTLNDYHDNVFMQLPGGLPTPQVMEHYLEDYQFASQRVSGVNPMRLARLHSSDERAKVLQRVTDAEWATRASTMLQSERVFVADYTGQDPSYRAPSVIPEVGTTTIGGKDMKKWLPKPLAFFYVDPQTSDLMPLAIEVSRGGRVFTPADAESSSVFGILRNKKDDWLFAKICVGCADGVHHEMSTHLGKGHFVMEPVCISTQRQLHPSHPLSLLLKTHTRFHLTNNNLAQYTLVAPGGPVEDIFGGTLAGCIQIAAETVAAYDINRDNFLEDIKARGLGDKEALPSFPYRDDGTLIWDALKQYIQAYVHYFYATDVDIQADVELQAWAAELSAPAGQGGGMLGGFPGTISTTASVVQLLTTIIFQCGPYHSAVNYLQYEYESLATNMPAACWADPSELAQKHRISRKDLLSMLPPFGAVTQQVDTTYLLSAFYHDEFGDYEAPFQDIYDSSTSDIFQDHPRILQIMETFKMKLKDAEKIINERNEARRVRYTGMLPSRIINSTSI